MALKKKSDTAFVKCFLQSLDFIIENPVMESAKDVVALKRIRTRLKRAIVKRQPR